MSTATEHGFLSEEVEQWISKIRAAHPEFFSLAHDVNLCCQTSMYSLEPHNKHNQELIVATLYVRIVSHYQAAILLAERGMMPQCRVVGRAMLEAVFTLCAIVNSNDSATEFVQEHYQSRLDYLKKFKNLHGGLPPDADSDEIQELEKELKEKVTQEKIKTKRVADWAKDANMYDWYLTVYALFSDAVHSKVQELDSYFVLSDSNEVSEIKWGPDDFEIEKVFLALIQAMLTTLKRSRSLFSIEDDDDIAELEQRLHSLAKERLMDDAAGRAGGSS